MTLDIETTDRDGAWIVSPDGKLDTLTAGRLETVLTEGIAERGGTVVLAMDGVEYVSSFGLRVILKAAKQARAAGGRFCASGLQDDVMNVFRLSGFLKILEVHPDLETALAA